MQHFTLKRGTVPVLLHIPHSSVFIPQECRGDFMLDDATLHYEANWMADLYTSELYTPTENPFWIVQSDISRIVIDMERFEDDEQESMSQYGMGAVYTKTSTGDVMRTLNAERKNRYLSTFFRPYHAAFENAVKQCVDEFGQCVILDCHSFPSDPRYYEDQTPNRPDICLGTVEGYTSAQLVGQARKHFEASGLSVKENTPFAGSILPIKLIADQYYAKRISTLMLETNRKLYMNEYSFEKNEKWNDTRSTIQNLLLSMLEIRN